MLSGQCNTHRRKSMKKNRRGLVFACLAVLMVCSIGIVANHVQSQREYSIMAACVGGANTLECTNDGGCDPTEAQPNGCFKCSSGVEKKSCQCTGTNTTCNPIGGSLINCGHKQWCNEAVYDDNDPYNKVLVGCQGTCQDSGGVDCFSGRNCSP